MTKTENTIIYTTTIAIHSFMHCQIQMPINPKVLTVIAAILITIFAVYSSLYHSYFAVVNAESITHPSLIIKTQNKLCQLQNRSTFSYDFTVHNYSNQDMNTLRTQCHTQILPCACAMPNEYEIKIEIYPLILAIADTLKISSLNQIWDFLADLFNPTKTNVRSSQNNVIQLLFHGIIQCLLYCLLLRFYLANMDETYVGKNGKTVVVYEEEKGKKLLVSIMCLCFLFRNCYVHYYLYDLST
ncbi:MAG: hypothetical protein GY928_13875 [Colwellia sp.]|nr:hypothetical protein [Colwellia sp.]